MASDCFVLESTARKTLRCGRQPPRQGPQWKTRLPKAICFSFWNAHCAQPHRTPAPVPSFRFSFWNVTP